MILYKYKDKETNMYKSNVNNQSKAREKQQSSSGVIFID
jgi:hypothetical protein